MNSEPGSTGEIQPASPRTEPGITELPDVVCSPVKSPYRDTPLWAIEQASASAINRRLQQLICRRRNSS